MPRAEIRGVHMEKTIGGCLRSRTRVQSVIAATAGGVVLTVPALDQCVLTQVTVHAGDDVTGAPTIVFGLATSGWNIATAQLTKGDYLHFGDAGSILGVGALGEDLTVVCVWGVPAGAVLLNYSYILVPGSVE